ncbi:HET-domain-containing protein [Annulohypoxylon maeteangense]|uniref:HET-domain-containing protein n=1 Tax=Annulohypoxylon maeteangense TaxID=1927788 RepID=UPI0020080BB3|nr:HET-domain-containing protein [Annulohypoxylon maeteangense]KAI0882855.1 HET-domain-containing protein [Annulohypoxylon maeteangense]
MDGVPGLKGDDVPTSPPPRTLPSYQYRPITINNHIRVFTLDAGVPGDPLRGTLQTVQIDSLNNHEVISYVWAEPGPPNCEWEILMLDDDDTEYPLKLKTGGIFAALQRLRLPRKKRRIWADQICVNQDDLDERSKQVRFMNIIYKKADRVLVWLGLDEKREAGLAFDLIHRLHGIFQSIVSNDKSHVGLVKDLEQEVGENHRRLHHITGRKWFTRGWVVQEIGTQAPATLFWGDEEIDWGMLYGVCERLAGYHHLRKAYDIRTSTIKFFFQRFIEPDKNSYHANRFNFIYELHRARTLHFTDDRDRIFAFLGHYSLQPTYCTNHELVSLKADYEISVEQVYKDIARRALQGSEGDSALISLAAVQHTSKSLPSNQETKDQIFSQQTWLSDVSKLPSWVPDWRNYQGFILSEPINPHRAHGVSVPKLEISGDTAVLQIHGLEVDEIEACSRVLVNKEVYRIKGNGDQDTVVEYLWREICGKGRFDLDDPYLNGDEAFFAFMQTLSNGCVQAAGREGKMYLDIDDSVWLKQAATYLVNTLGESDMISLRLRSLGRRDQLNGVEEEWSRMANGASKNRKFARTSKGYYVLGPAVMEKGDLVCVLFGGKMPFCIRPFGEQRYLLVGECYVHGLMKGEAMDMASDGKLFERTFELF